MEELSLCCYLVFVSIGKEENTYKAFNIRQFLCVFVEDSSLPTESEIETEATETDQESGDSVIDRRVSSPYFMHYPMIKGYSQC